MVDLSSSMRRSENGCQGETRARVTSSWLIPGNVFSVFSCGCFLHPLHVLVFIVSHKLISIFTMLFGIRLSDLSYGTAEDNQSVPIYQGRFCSGCV